jgi:hypothetical protein
MCLHRAVALAALCLLVGPGVGLAFGECMVPGGAMERIPAEFEGQAAGRRVRLYLAIDWPHEERIDGRVSGMGASGERPRFLSGAIAPDCVVTVDELEGQPRGSWTLRFESATRLTGRRVEPGSPPSAVRLGAVPAPSCDGRGPWRTFRSAAWPITFDYPESWLLDARDGWVGLSCHSLLSQMRGWDSLAMTEGLGTGDLDDFPGIGPIRTLKDFRTVNGRDWMIGAFCPQEPGGVEAPWGCLPARQTVAHGMTLLQGRVERSRVTTLHYLLLLPARWVALETYDYLSRLEGGGEVLFGDDVVSRVVRSMRPVAPAR